MKKNLKKVISTVVALTLSVSSFAAAFAADFSDVADTASYAQAVDELVALGIIEGYGDGTFLPDNNITRAEVTKMIVAAIGSTNAAEAAAGQNTKFTDVDGSHWAAGFVTVGTDQAGFINGYGDGTFGPENNVTYAQVVKMLVASLGYTTYAEANGGWPGGYMSYGNSLGIVDGVKANQDTEVTRAQVAQLIDNALDVPLCMITGWETDVWGQSKPTLEVKDGYGDGYQTLLTNKHDAYKVKGRVKATSKTNGGLKAGEVIYTVTNTRNFDDVNYDKGQYEDVNPVLAGTSGAEDQLLTYSEALIQKNDDSDYTILSITPLGKNKVETFKSDDLDDENKNYMKGSYQDGDSYNIGEAILGERYLYAYKDGSTTSSNSYRLSNNVKLYVNGVELGNEATADNLNTYLVNNNVGEVTLIDTPDIESGQTSTDGYYDYIMVTYYVSALVDSVEEVSDGAEIYLDVFEPEMDSPIVLNTDDEDFSYKIELNGKAIDYKDLQQDDVIAVSYDVSNDFPDSNFYDMIVTRGTVDGRVNTYNEKKGGYQIGDEYYKSVEDDDDGRMLEVGSEVTLYVDAFNRFVKSEEMTVNKKYAVLENVYLKTGEDVYVARLATADGTIQTIQFQTKVNASKAEEYARICNKNGLDGGEKNPIAERVVEYKVTSSSTTPQISSLVKIGSTATATAQEYKASTNKIGNIRMNDATKILNASDYDKDKNYSTLSLSDLTDGAEYTVVGFDKVDSIYRFVIVLEGNGGYTVETPIAIYSQTEKTYDPENDQQVDSLVVYTANADKSTKSQSFMVADDYQLPEKLSEGDVIVYKLDSDGYVDDVQVIFDTDLNTYTDFRKQVSDNLTNDDNEADPTFSAWLNPIQKWVDSVNGYDKDGRAEVFFGPLTDKNGNDISLGRVTVDSEGREVTPENDVEEITINSDANVYVYDFNKRTDDRLSKTSVGSIRATSIPNSIKLPDEYNDKTIINWSDSSLTNKINYAFVKTIDGDATDVFVVVAPR